LLISFYIVPVLHAQKNRKKEKILQKESKKKESGFKTIVFVRVCLFFLVYFVPLVKRFADSNRTEKKKKI